MQRVARNFALVFVALVTPACMDQGRNDDALEAMQAARAEAARESRLQALERQQAFLLQQIANLSSPTNASGAHASGPEGDRDKQLDEMSAKIDALTLTIAAWRDEDRPPAIDAEAQRLAERTSAADRASAIRQVQALIDAGQIKLLMRAGRIQLAQVRPIETTNPYEAAPAKPAPTAPPAPTTAPPRITRPVDRLGF